MEAILIGLGSLAVVGSIWIFGLGYMPLAGGGTFLEAVLPTLVGVAATVVMVSAGSNALNQRSRGWPLNYENGVQGFLIGLGFLVWPVIFFQISRLAAYLDSPTLGLWLYRFRFLPSYLVGLLAAWLVIGAFVTDTYLRVRKPKPAT